MSVFSPDLRINVLACLYWLLLFAATAEDPLSRQKRFLIFPRANPQRLQLIGGFGIPVDLQQESITVGYVIKCVYYLPWNSSHLIPPFLDRHEFETVQRRDTWSVPLVLPAGNNWQEDGRLIISGSDSLPQSPLAESRWIFYRALEQIFEQKGYDGHSCVLRAICESSEAAFSHTSGLIGELLHIMFTPSTSNDEVADDASHARYRQAERILSSVSPQNQHSVCESMYAECTISLIGSFSNYLEHLTQAT
ncbi:uncharacterized protein LOC131207657 [Anopheles bellator]|uniref:uncharacterized protein LOC131207657 n=1 Tax=Anopheles bellator TaxID=139047 RepID=UPI0026494D24|nr:uncharacterized protein LOC131207657 [Anopheles bellator]